jgi:hypothetical protein
MLRLTLATLLLMSSASHANNCEAIRAQIDAKIRASGVGSFSLSTVDADTKVTGKVVGTCDLGTRKIVYIQGGTAASAPPAAKPADRMLTECRDGSVSIGGDCRKTPRTP